MRNQVGLAIVVLSFVGCGGEPLRQLQVGQAAQDQANDSANDNANDSTNDADDDVRADNDDPGESVVVVPDNDAEPVVCVNGGNGASWRDQLPARPASVPLTEHLADGSGVVGSCDGDGLVDGDNFDAVSSIGHVSGRYYFELSVDTFEEGWSQVGVFADPADLFHLDAFFMDEISSAGTYLSDALIGVAVDVDAGVVGFYSDGDLVDVKEMALLPGIGAFHAGAFLMSGNEVTLNFGSAPFAHTPPHGYVAWETNEDGAAGACRTAAPHAVVTADVSPICADLGECSISSFESDADADTALVVLGAYDSGAQANWQWAVDEDGNAFEEPVDGGHGGSILVNVTRPGRVALVLSAYEPTAWTLQVGEDTDVVSVSVYGFHAQTISGVPEGVTADVHSICGDANGGGNCDVITGENFPVAPHQWPFDTGGGDTQGFVRFIESALCLPLKVFAGSYATHGFRVE